MGRLTALPARMGVMAQRVRPAPKTADPFYLSTRWRAFASAIKRQRGYVCEECGHDGDADRRFMHADHVVERRDGGADFDPLNVRVLCQACHNRKTARAAQGRGG